MAKIANATFSGKVGKYSFEVYPSDTSFNAVGAVYVFTKREIGPAGKGKHTILYIGETDSLKDRIPNHEKWPCIKQNGVNCICIHQDDNGKSRLEMEADLRSRHNTPCSDQ